MPKTRRAGRKYQLRRVLAQLQEPVPSHGLLSTLGCEFERQPLSSIDNRDAIPRVNYNQCPFDVTCFKPTPVPERRTSYRLIPIDVPRTYVDIEDIRKDDPRYHLYASRQRVSLWKNNWLPNGATHISFIPKATIDARRE